MSHRTRHFGKFHHIGEFLNTYKKTENNKKIDKIHNDHPGKLQEQVNTLKKSVPDVVEVQATILKFFGDNHDHYQFHIAITQLVTPSQVNDIDTDVHNCINAHSEVFLAVRYGDNEGISQPIREDIQPGNLLHLKGQWITARDAYAHDGEKTSVMHFTHHPIGFICVVNSCYS